MSTDIRNLGSQIIDTLNMNNVQLEEIARRIMINREGVDSEIINKWKESIIQISNESSKIINSIDITKKYFQSSEYNTFVQSEMIRYDGESNSSANSKSNNSDPSDLKDLIYNNILKKCKSSKFSSSNTDKLQEILHEKKKSKKNDEIEVIDKELTEADFICPFTGKIMEEPMKSSACKHHVSSQAFNEMMRISGSRKCPVAGCSGMWTKATSSIDNEFEYRLKRFLLKQKDNSSNSSSQVYTNAVDDSDDDDDGGYTQL